MTNKYRIELFQDNFTTVNVCFGNYPLNQAKNKPIYTYKVPNTLQLVAGDFAVVQVGTDMKVVTVLEVHDTPKINYNADFDYTWIVSKIETTEYRKLIEQDIRLVEELNELAFRRQKQDLIKELEAEFGTGVIETISNSLGHSI